MSQTTLSCLSLLDDGLSNFPVPVPVREGLHVPGTGAIDASGSGSQGVDIEVVAEARTGVGTTTGTGAGTAALAVELVELLVGFVQASQVESLIA